MSELIPFQSFKGEKPCIHIFIKFFILQIVKSLSVPGQGSNPHFLVSILTPSTQLGSFLASLEVQALDRTIRPSFPQVTSQEDHGDHCGLGSA